MKSVLVYGGRGALGQSVVRLFRSQNPAWNVISVDLFENSDAHHSIKLSRDAAWHEQANSVDTELSNIFGNRNEKLDAVLCVAGGWAGGNLLDPDLFKNTELMWKVSVQTSILAAHIAAKYMKPGGLLVLPGAASALGPTPSFIGYGIAKAAVHHLVLSLASEGSGMPEKSTVTSVLPVVLDTPQNRSSMPKANFKNWTPLETVAETLYNWANGVDRPKNGSLVKIVTKDGITTYVTVN